jgi:murein DD-endopeptidase MepM/ murein hydrolase activator NlpD
VRPNSLGRQPPTAAGFSRKYRPCIHLFILALASLSLLSTVFFTGHLEVATKNVASPVSQIAFSDVAAAVAPQEDAVLHASVLPQTLVSAQSTATPMPLVLQSPAPMIPAGEMMMAASAPATPVPTPPPPVYIIYTVQEGDTIEGLAARYGIADSSVLWNNLDLENADTLAVGQFLRVPMSDGIIYDIRMGDTLSDIAAGFSVDVQSIVSFGGNHLANADGIAENQIVFVPNGTMPVPPPPTATPEPPSPPSDETSPAPEPSEPGPPSSSGFIWPVQGRVSSYYGPSHPLGIDIDQYNSPGAPIRAAASGVITFAGGNSCCSYGFYVVINHQNGFETLYAHMASFAVSQGEYVNQGDVIGYVGLTGRTTGYHLHFEVHLNGSIVNPLDYLP